jgi:hypothetical protein
MRIQGKKRMISLISNLRTSEGENVKANPQFTNSLIRNPLIRNPLIHQLKKVHIKK